MAEEYEGVVTGVMEGNEGKGGLSLMAMGEPSITNLIHTVRGVQVMLDSDLAKLYEVEVRALNQAVSRNSVRFPERFCFRLTSEETETLKSRSVISSEDGWGGRRTPHRVFTEQGVAMLSAVLRSKTAVAVSIRIMDSFVEMRHFITDNEAMFERIRAVELRQMEYQRSTEERFERVFDYMQTHDAPKQKVFFKGQLYDAFELLVSLVQRAECEIVLIDGYVDVGTLNILAKKRKGVSVTVWTRPRTRLSSRDVDTFNAQYHGLVVKHTTAFHDRFLILDGREAYLVGTSIKDAGKRGFGIARIEDEETTSAFLARLAS